jgi:hypothetical protein
MRLNRRFPTTPFRGPRVNAGPTCRQSPYLVFCDGRLPAPSRNGGFTSLEDLFQHHIQQANRTPGVVAKLDGGPFIAAE